MASEIDGDALYAKCVEEVQEIIEPPLRTTFAKWEAEHPNLPFVGWHPLMTALALVAGRLSAERGASNELLTLMLTSLTLGFVQAAKPTTPTEESRH